MVSMNPSSPEDFYVDPNAAALPGINPFSPTPSTVVDAAAPDDTTCNESNSKKVRKPYTISKSRESWTEPEHDKFLEALQLFDRDWKKIEAFIGSKSVIQIRSHAQKYFLKVQKSGTNEHLPPPRPKRKASQPYPKKAQKIGVVPQATESLHTSPLPLDVVQRLEPTSVPIYSNNNAVLLSWPSNSQTAGVQTGTVGDVKPGGPIIANNPSSSTESTAMARTANKLSEAMKHGPPLRVLPDFAQVYSFIGSVFDPEASSHLQRLKKMDPIDVETALLLMRNLSINLTSPDFEDHRRLLSSYDIDSDKAISGGINNNIACGD